MIQDMKNGGSIILNGDDDLLCKMSLSKVSLLYSSEQEATVHSVPTILNLMDSAELPARSH